MFSMRTKTISSMFLLLLLHIADSVPEDAPTWEQLPYITASAKYDSDIVWLTHWPGLIRETLIRRVKSPSSGYGFNTGTSDQGFNSGSSGRGFNLGYPSQGYNSGQGYNPGHDNNDGSKNFRSRRWGSLLPGLRTRDPTLSPPSTWAEIFRHTFLQSHLQNFRKKPKKT